MIRRAIYMLVTAAVVGCGSSPTASSGRPLGASTQSSVSSDETWYFRTPTDVSHLQAVSWSTERPSGPPLAVPTIGGKPVTHASPAPDGAHVLASPDPSTRDGRPVVFDRTGKVVLQLDDPNALYFWDQDGQGFCVMHFPFPPRPAELGYVSLQDPQERHIYTFPADTAIGMHGVVACSLTTDRIVVEEIVPPDHQPDATVVSAIVVLDPARDRVLAHYEPQSPGQAVHIFPSADGLLYAENPIDPSLPSLVIDTSNGHVVARLANRHVARFDGVDRTILTVDPPILGARQPKVRIQAQSLSTGTVLWERTAYYRQSLAWPGHAGLIVGSDDEAPSPANGHDAFFLNASGTATLVATGVLLA